jgi:hypothetical protein
LKQYGIVSRSTFTLLLISLLTHSFFTYARAALFLMKLKFSSRAMDTLSLNLQPGFKFSPTDVQIFDHYLKLKITGNDEELYFIREVQFFKQEPWDMPGT